MKKLLLLFLFSFSILYSQTATPPTGGAGTLADPYLITSIENLYWLTQNSAQWNKHYKQTADIDVSASTGWDGGNGFLPIGHNLIRFSGTYDGQNHIISNLYINRGTICNGLFGEISYSEIKNLKVLNASFPLAGQYAGVLVGLSSYSNIRNCVVSGTISGTSHLGGIVGLASETTIQNCFSNCNLTGSLSWIGGLVGQSDRSSLLKSFAAGSVTGNEYVGGFVGSVVGMSGSIQNCYASATVTGNNISGGLAGGINDKFDIINSYSYGSVVSTTNGGGLIGQSSGGLGFITNSYWDMNTSGVGFSSGGTGKTTAQMKNSNTYRSAGWDFSLTWNLGSAVNNGYPYLIANAPIPVTPPAAFDLSAPAHNSVGIPVTEINFTWSASAGVVSYEFIISDAPDFSSPPHIKPGISTNSYLFNVANGSPVLNPFTTYYWKVKAINTHGETFSTSVKQFRTQLAAPVLSAPANNSINQSVTPHLTWNFVPNAGQYIVEISSSPIFATSDYAARTTELFHDVPAGRLNNFTKYYWKVIAVPAIGSVEYGKYSEVRNFTTVLGTPVLSSPGNAAIGVGLKPLLQWGPVTGRSAYRLEVNTNNTFTGTSIFDNSSLTGTEQLISGLYDNVTYYWRVTALAAGGHVSISSIFSFSTTRASQTSPADNLVAVQLPVNFQWPAIIGTDKYTLQISKQSDFQAQVVYNNDQLINNSISIGTPTLEWFTDYYWRTSARSNTSVVWHFKTSLAPPVLNYPTNNSVGQPLTARLTWNTIPSAAQYQIQISTNQSFTLPLTYTVRTLNLFKDIPAGTLTANTVYYWRVRGVETVGGEIFGAWSEIRNFRPIVGSVTTPTPSYPIGGAIVYSARPELFWYVSTGGTGYTYEIQVSRFSDFETNPFDTYTSTTMSYKFLADLLSNTTYYWRVRAYKESLNLYSAYSPVTSFKTDVSVGPVIPTPSYPIGNAVVYTMSPTLYWYTGAAPAGLKFRVQYSTTNDFAVIIETIDNITNLYQEIADLTAGTTYFWRVKSILGTLESDYSAPAKFTVYANVAGTPTVPVITWPTDGAVAYTVSPTLYWYLLSYAPGLKFRVQYKKDGAPDWTAAPATDQLYLQLSNLDPGSKYWWRVRSFIPNGALSNFTTPISFRTTLENGPAVPHLSYPVGGTIVYTTEPILNWWLNSYIGIHHYTVNISYNADLTAPFYTSANLTATSLDLQGLNVPLIPGATYYWGVTSYDAAGNHTNSAIERFTIAPGTTNAVMPLTGSPKDGTIVGTTTPTLSWYLPVATEGLAYDLQYSKSPDFLNAVEIQDIENVNTVINGLENGTKYYWRTRSVKNGIYSQYSYRSWFIPSDGVTSINEEDIIPAQFTVEQNYPNPFNPTTEIRYGLSKEGYVSIKIYNIMGQEVNTLISEQKNAGTYRVQWNGDNNTGSKVTSGTYLCRVTSGAETKTIKMILIK